MTSDYDDHELGRELTAAKARIAELEEALEDAKEDANEWHETAVAEGKAKLRAEARCRELEKLHEQALNERDTAHDHIADLAVAVGRLKLQDTCESGQHTFSWRMGLDSCRYCGLPTGGAEPDYEALGYPETSYGYQPDVDDLSGVLTVTSRWLHSLADNPTDKE